jgi:hypothetical protein
VDGAKPPGGGRNLRLAIRIFDALGGVRAADWSAVHPLIAGDRFPRTKQMEQVGASSDIGPLRVTMMHVVTLLARGALGQDPRGCVVVLQQEKANAKSAKQSHADMANRFDGLLPQNFGTIAFLQLAQLVEFCSRQLQFVRSLITNLD